MQADPLTLGKILSERHRFVVPIYQRTYSWEWNRQLQPFWAQLCDKASARISGQKSKITHYMGALLVIPEGEVVFGKIQNFYVIDGQQRLSTFHLLFSALRALARANGNETLANELLKLLTFTDLTKVGLIKEDEFKLQPTAYDLAIFRDCAILGAEDLQRKYLANRDRKVAVPLPLAAWSRFYTEAVEFIADDSNGDSSEDRLKALITAAFEDFKLIVITLSEADDAQVIFETLNSGGVPLSAMDLVRNELFHRATKNGEDPEKLMQSHWKTFEDGFWKQSTTQGRLKKPRMDFYLAHTLAVEKGSDVSLSDLYAEYKELLHAKNQSSAFAVAKMLTRYEQIYRTLVEPQGDSDLALVARELIEFDVRTAYPLVFVVASCDATVSEKREMYTLILSYIVRRALCGLTVKNYNQTFIKLAASLSRDKVSLNNLAAEFLALTGHTVEFPSDQQVRHSIEADKQYKKIRSNRLKYIFMRIERSLRTHLDEDVSIGSDLTIEHVLPDSWYEHWPLPNGEIHNPSAINPSNQAFVTDREHLKHTLGNLTLLTPAANPSVGKLGFEIKRKRLSEALLKLNYDIAKVEVWNEDHIRSRSRVLGESVIKIWPAPGQHKS